LMRAAKNGDFAAIRLLLDPDHPERSVAIVRHPADDHDQ